MRFGVIMLALFGLSGCLGGSDAVPLAAVEMAGAAPDGEAEAQLEEAAVDTPVTEEQDTAPHKGLFGLFRGKREEPTIASVDEEADSDVVASVATSEPEQQPRTKDSQSPQLTPGTLLPFGQIGVACGIRGRALGKQVDRFPERGKGYRLYDSNPDTIEPRTHYLTGFKDGCPRQFTAGLAMMGSPVLHEQMRYDSLNKDLPITAADKAYEKIKARICRVSKGKPCPEKRIRALEKGMAFVTIYERFGGINSWAEILLHNGAVAASSTRQR